MWMYESDREKETKEDYVDLLKEIEAYRELDGQDFDFGTGIIKNDMAYGSEDAYYEMDIQVLEEWIEDWGYPVSKETKKRRKFNLNRYDNKRFYFKKERQKDKYIYKHLK